MAMGPASARFDMITKYETTALTVSTASVMPVLVTTSSMVSGREKPACCCGYWVYGWAMVCWAPYAAAPLPNCAYPPCDLGRERNIGLLLSRTVGFLS